MKWLKELRTNIKAKLDTMSLAIIAISMTGSVMLATYIQGMFLSGVSDPNVMGYTVPVISGILTTIMFLVIYKYVLKKEDV